VTYCVRNGVRCVSTQWHAEFIKKFGDVILLIDAKKNMLPKFY